MCKGVKGLGVQSSNCTDKFRVIFRTLGEKQGIYAIEVRKERLGGARLLWGGKCLAILLRVLPDLT
jgi:hypothetical protein